MQSPDAARTLLLPSTVRARAHEMLALGIADKLTAFTVDMTALPAAAARVVATIRRTYPTLDIPFHARWRHFVMAGEDLWPALAASISDPAEKARTAFDLAIVSVLLDAGAGMGWRYRDVATGHVSARSEGLALASLRMFAAGVFSVHDGQPLRADSARLVTLSPRDIDSGFQVTADNPLVGVEGRAALLNALGRAVTGLPGARPGGLFDVLSARATAGHLPAPVILACVLHHLGPIWPSRLALAGVPLGDTWQHPLISGAAGTQGLVPFHKLSQWLSYSLIEPLEAAGITVTDVDGLTGLPEYRNGGLFVDMGVLSLRDPAMADAHNTVDSPLVVEWRALTVALLDEIAPLVRAELGLSAEAFPLARVLEGGTWATGRELAAERRADGGSPIRIVSDGTVF